MGGLCQAEVVLETSPKLALWKSREVEGGDYAEVVGAAFDGAEEVWVAGGGNGEDGAGGCDDLVKASVIVAEFGAEYDYGREIPYLDAT